MLRASVLVTSQFHVPRTDKLAWQDGNEACSHGITAVRWRWIEGEVGVQVENLEMDVEEAAKFA